MTTRRRRRHVSQREAAALKRRIADLERELAQIRNTMASEYPGVHFGIFTLDHDPTQVAMLRAANKLGYAIVLRPTMHTACYNLYAVPLAPFTGFHNQTKHS